MLNTQYRMHPDIQKAIDQFYIDEKNIYGLKSGLKNPDLEKCHQIQDKIFHKKYLVCLKTKKVMKKVNIKEVVLFLMNLKLKE